MGRGARDLDEEVVCRAQARLIRAGPIFRATLQSFPLSAADTRDIRPRNTGAFDSGACEAWITCAGIGPGFIDAAGVGVACVELACAFVYILAARAVSEKPFQAAAFKTSCEVCAFGVGVAGVHTRLAFVRVHAVRSELLVARKAVAGIGTQEVFAFCVEPAEIFIQAFVDIRAVDAVSFEAISTGAVEASLGVFASPEDRAVVFEGQAFVEVFASHAVACVASDAVAGKGAR